MNWRWKLTKSWFKFSNGLTVQTTSKRLGQNQRFVCQKAAIGHLRRSICSEIVSFFRTIWTTFLIEHSFLHFYPSFLATRNQQSLNGYPPVLRFTKSTTHVAVSREMVDFILYELDLTLLMKRIEQSAKIVDGRHMFKDELLMGSLNAEDAIGAPGGFTHHCLDKGVETPGLTAWVL